MKILWSGWAVRSGLDRGPTVGENAENDMIKNRMNGEVTDIGAEMLSRPICNGSFKRVNAEELSDEVLKRAMQYRVNPKYKTKYVIRYDAGSIDKEWLCKVDCNYLSRLEREGKLQEQEPDVWHLRKVCRNYGENVTDIRAWWRTKVFLPNIGQLLEAPEQEYSLTLGRVLAEQLVQNLPRGSKDFELGLLNIVRGYLGLKLIKPNIERLALSFERGIFSEAYYESKDRGLAEAVTRGNEPGSVTKHSKPSCVMM